MPTPVPAYADLTPDLVALLTELAPHPALGSRPLRFATPASLSAIALRAAADDKLWRSRLQYDIGHRAAVRLAHDTDHEIWLLGWLPGQETGLHDHAGALAAFTVVSGSLSMRGPDVSLTLAPGQVRVLGSRQLHSISNPWPVTAASIHVYSPRRPD